MNRRRNPWKPTPDGQRLIDEAEQICRVHARQARPAARRPVGLIVVVVVTIAAFIALLVLAAVGVPQ